MYTAPGNDRFQSFESYVNIILSTVSCWWFFVSVGIWQSYVLILLWCHICCIW